MMGGPNKVFLPQVGHGVNHNNGAQARMMAVSFQSEKRLQRQESVEMVLIEPEQLVADDGLNLLSRDFCLTSPIFLKTDKQTSSFFLVIGAIKIRRVL